MKKKNEKEKKEEGCQVLFECNIIIDIAFKEDSVSIEANGTIPDCSPFSKIRNHLEEEFSQVVNEVGRDLALLHCAFKKESKKTIGSDKEKIH